MVIRDFFACSHFKLMEYILMNTTPVPPAPADVASIKVRLDDTERLLKDFTARTRRGNLITIIVGVLLLTVMGSYFAYGYSEISTLTEPNMLIGAAENWIEEQLPEVRKSLEAEVNKSAPIWAESLSKQAQASLPTIREKLEEYVLQQVDQSVENAVNLTEDHFRQLLRDKRTVLEAGFEDLATSPHLAKESLARLEDAMEGIFERDMKEGAGEVFATLNLMSTKLTRLKVGKDLTPEESREREILMQFRRLQLEPEKPAPAAAKSDLETEIPLPTGL